jgi:predicted kinase
MVVTTSGLPGTGKTTLAQALARRLGMVHVATDVVRKRLAGLEPTDHSRAGSEDGLYSAEMTRRTYAAVRAAGARWLRRGVSVVLDGTFTEPRQRDLVGRLAGRLGVPLLLVVTTTDDETIRRRLEARESDPANASDATWPVYQDLRKRYPIPKDVPSDDVLIDETGGAGADAVIHHLARQT